MSQYSVKNVKSFEGMEGYGYNASLYRNNKRVAKVNDYGDGGCIDMRFEDLAEEKIFNEYVDSLPEYNVNAAVGVKGVEMIKQSADTVVGKLVDDFENDKKFRRICKTKTLFLLKSDDEDESFRTLNVPYGEKAQQWLDKKYGDKVAEVVNHRYL